MYERGATLELVASHLGNRLLKVRISRIYRPFSFSCVLGIEILHGLEESDDVPQRAALKLFDRRFAEGLRTEHRLDAWDTAHEAAYVDFVNSGEASQFSNMLQQSDYLDEPETGWGPAQCETYLQGWCSELFSTELEVYQHMKALQGNEIPRLFSAVTLSPHAQASATTREAGNDTSLLQIPGLLMEQIAGNTFWQMPDFIPRTHWQAMVDEAIQIVRRISDLGVLNEDASPSNLIPSLDSGPSGPFRVVMVDFAQCIIRRSGQTDEEWATLKANQDEEGSVSRGMAACLARVGFRLNYTSSNRYRMSNPDFR